MCWAEQPGDGGGRGAAPAVTETSWRSRQRQPGPGTGCGTCGTEREGPGPQGAVWGAELPREARVWARALTCPVPPRGEQNSQMVLSKRGEPGQGDPLGAVSRAPSSSSWASSGAYPCRARNSPSMAPGAASHLIFPPTRQGWYSASPASSAAGMPGSLLPVWVPP